ncbi:MAG: YraN family protein [Pseudomonadota bacterium]
MTSGRGETSARKTRRQREQTGRKAETLALWWLRLKGYSVIMRRAKTPVGELDILCSKGDQLVVVEVKYRDDPDRALEALNARQLDRCARALEYLLATHPPLARFPNIRFDAMLVSRRAYPRHIKNLTV